MGGSSERDPDGPPGWWNNSNSGEITDPELKDQVADLRGKGVVSPDGRGEPDTAEVAFDAPEATAPEMDPPAQPEGASPPPTRAPRAVAAEPPRTAAPSTAAPSTAAPSTAAPSTAAPSTAAARSAPPAQSAALLPSAAPPRNAAPPRDAAAPSTVATPSTAPPAARTAPATRLPGLAALLATQAPKRAAPAAPTSPNPPKPVAPAASTSLEPPKLAASAPRRVVSELPEDVTYQDEPYPESLAPALGSSAILDEEPTIQSMDPALIADLAGHGPPAMVAPHLAAGLSGGLGAPRVDRAVYVPPPSQTKPEVKLPEIREPRATVQAIGPVDALVPPPPPMETAIKVAMGVGVALLAILVIVVVAGVVSHFAAAPEDDETTESP